MAIGGMKNFMPLFILSYYYQNDEARKSRNFSSRSTTKVRIPSLSCTPTNKNNPSTMLRVVFGL